MPVGTPDVESPTSSSTGPDGRFWNRPVRNSVIGALSAVVLLMGVLFVALPAQAGVAFAVTNHELPGRSAIVYGRVIDHSGDPVAGAHVKLIRWVHGQRHVLRRHVTNPRGVYRFVVRHRVHHGVTLRISDSMSGHHYFGIRRIRIHPRAAFQVQAKFVKWGGFFFLPVSTY